MRTSIGVTAVSVALLSSCSWWTRFDDLKDNVPVVEVQDPGGIPGFATTMATVEDGDRTALLLLGEPNLAPKGAVYSITNDDPGTSPARSGFCPNSRCLFGDSPAPLRNITIDGATHPSCFVMGVGDRNNTLGLVGSCLDGTDFVLGVPGAVPEWGSGVVSPEDVISKDLSEADLGRLLVGDFRYAASSDDQPLIAAATKYIGASWYYPPGATTAVRITPFANEGELPDDPRLVLGDTFGSEIAVATVAQGGQLIAISAPRGVGEDTHGRVWLYRVVDGKIVHNRPNPDFPAPIGCLPGFSKNFGTYMHTGRLFGGSSDELFISDGVTISIYDAGALADSPPTSDCGGAPLGGGYITSVTCVETGSVKGCPYITTGFGRSIAIADVDGNGKNELVVGAPALDVNDTQNAGAVLVYDVDPAGANTRLLEARVISSHDTGDALGTSVAALRIGTRDVVAAGAPGLGSFFLFYCSTLGGAGSSSSRCL